MTTILLGMGLLLLTLAGFSLFSTKAPKGSLAMSGMANAAVATFLVEAVHKYISGDLIGLAFLGETGAVSGSMGGVAAGILVPLSMGANPVFAVVAGVAVGGYGILPGFLAGYLVGFLAPLVEKYLPEGLDTILGALLLAPLARFVAFAADPVVNAAMGYIGETISAATQSSPVIMGFLLGGIIKMICTSPSAPWPSPPCWGSPACPWASPPSPASAAPSPTASSSPGCAWATAATSSPSCWSP